MSNADREKWENRYQNRTTGEIGTPDPSLEEILDELPSTGPALDLAGGSGRHALRLARHGLDVTLVDVAPTGLALAQTAATAAGLALTTQVVDLDNDPLPAGPFAVIFCSWYLPPDSRWQELRCILKPDGLLVLIHPTRQNLERHIHPSARFCVVEKDLRQQLSTAGFTVRAATSGWDTAGKHTLRVLAQPSLKTA
jgi:tellurite methyltransferase